MNLALNESLSSVRLSSDSSWQIDTALIDLEYALAYRALYKLDANTQSLGNDTITVPISLNYNGEVNTSEMLDFNSDVLLLIYNFIDAKYSNYEEGKSLSYLDLTEISRSGNEINVKVVFSTIGVDNVAGPPSTNCSFNDGLYSVNTSANEFLLTQALNSNCNPFWKKKYRTMVPSNIDPCTGTLVPGYKLVKLYQPGTRIDDHFTIEGADAADFNYYDHLLPPYWFDLFDAPVADFNSANITHLAMKDQVDGFADYGDSKKNQIMLQGHRDVIEYEVRISSVYSRAINSVPTSMKSYNCFYTTAVPIFMWVNETLPPHYAGLYIGSGSTPGG